jgi:hypothetical protein
VRDLISTELRVRLLGLTKRRPERCAHNCLHQLDDRRTISGIPNPNYNRLSPPDDSQLPRIRLCLYYDDLRICEEAFVAESCEAFTPLMGKDQAVEELEAQLRDSEWVGKHMPELAALLWVLDQKPTIPWYMRLLVWVYRPKIEPAKPENYLVLPDDPDN